MDIRRKYIKFIENRTKFVKVDTAETFSVYINGDDNFFSDIKKHLQEEGVQGETRITINSLIVPKNVYEEIKTSRYDIELGFLIGTKNGDTYMYDGAYEIKIPNVSIKFISSSNVKNKNFGNMELVNYEAIIPYRTKFEIQEITDEE